MAATHLQGASSSGQDAPPLQEGECIFSLQQGLSQERLPMLEVVIERFVHGLVGHLRNLTSDNIDVSLDNLSFVRFCDFTQGVAPQSLIGVVQAVEWENTALVIANADLIRSIVDVLLGGRKPHTLDESANRPYTTIERNLLERFFNIAFYELSLAFSPIGSVKFDLQRIENHIKFANIVRPASPCVFVQLKISVEGRGGVLGFLLPRTTLEPVYQALTELFLGNKFGPDVAWSTHMERELWTTDVVLDAVLDEQSFDLGSVLGWEQGTLIPLSVGRDCPVTVKCRNQNMFSGKMGHRRGLLALSIEEALFKKEQEE